ncbi:MAG: hypothetical protein QW372_05885 [Nitrososphaerales archaeon]
MTFNTIGKLISSLLLLIILFLSIILSSFVNAHMPLTGKWIDDYLVDTTTKIIGVREEAKIIIHLGNMKYAGFAPSDLNIIVEFIDSNSNKVIGSYRALSWAENPEIYGNGPGYYKTQSGPLFNETGIYKVRVKIIDIGEAEFEISVVEKSMMSEIGILIGNVLRVGVFGAIVVYIFIYIWRKKLRKA